MVEYETCPWCSKDTCEWFIGLPCKNSNQKYFMPHPDEVLAKNSQLPYQDPDMEYYDECDHCPCYFDGERCCDCGELQ